MLKGFFLYFGSNVVRFVASITKRFKLRLNNHKSRLRAHTRLYLFNNDREKDEFLYQHFYSPGHNGLEDVSIKLINRVLSIMS